MAGDVSPVAMFLRKTIFDLSSGLMIDCHRCVAHEAGPEARRGECVQVQGGRAEAAGQDCSSS